MQISMLLRLKHCLRSHIESTSHNEFPSLPFPSLPFPCQTPAMQAIPGVACVAGIEREGKGSLGAMETRGTRKEGGKETPARGPLYFLLLTC